jgi:amino acid adenylation domain-containing protein
VKLADFQLPDDDSAARQATIDGFNRTATPYERQATVHQLFAAAAAADPSAPAVLYEHECLSYGELDRRSNALARVLMEAGIRREDMVVVMVDRSPAMVIAMLAIVKAGAAYVPVAADLPHERIRHILGDTAARILIFERAFVRTANRLQWECPRLDTILCIDSDDVHGEIEPDEGLMDLTIWDHVASETFDDISGGGWKSSYTGQWLGRDVMDGYGENVRRKLAPLLTPASRVLEVGCASGISMFRLAPLVARYLGTDLSPGIIEWTAREAARQGLTNVELTCCAAHDIRRLAATGMDVVVLNSVTECFPGHNYFRGVIRASIDAIGERGWIFLGNVWDQDLKDAFLASLLDWKRRHPDDPTKTERGGELYLSRGYLDDLGGDFPEIAGIDYSLMLGDADSELSRFGFDALLRIDKTAASSRRKQKQQLDRRAIDAASEASIPEQTSADGLIYVMYTSGTSGTPKGVLIEHRSVVRLVRRTNYIALGPGDRVMQTGALGFDASTFEIWGPLLNGGAVCLPRGRAFLDARELGRLVRDHRVTTMFLTTGLFNQLVDTDVSAFADLETLLTGGEKVSAQHCNAVRRACPGLALKHVYGPTESTTFATSFDVTRDYDRDIPIGAPIANTTAWIVDDNGALAPVGVAREQRLGGAGRAPGYSKVAGQTAGKFVAHPRDDNARVYRTGDLCRWRDDGAIEFIGRIDSQVKIRGYRIELEEIESAILRLAGVTQVAVVMRGTEGARLLTAFVGATGWTADTLRRACQQTLPDYMVPSRFHVAERLPLNASGKVDRRAMLELASAESVAAEAAAKGSPTEQTVAGIWEALLDRRPIGVNDDFFELGGHSLTVMRLIAQVRDATGVTLPVSAVFRGRTVGELARYIDDIGGQNQGIFDDEMVLLNAPAEGARPVFAMPPGSGYALAYQQLAESMPESAFHAFAFLDRPDAVQRYVDAIVRTDPDGPAILLGYSAGGKLAFLVAQALEAAGREVAGVIIVDAARYTAPVEFSERDVAQAVDEFAAGVTSVALLERITGRVRAYRRFIGACVEAGTIAADIHLLRAAESGDFVDGQGRVIATLDRWGELTRGQFVDRRLDGAHRELLSPPWLGPNSDVIRKSVAELRVRKAEPASARSARSRTE